MEIHRELLEHVAEREYALLRSLEELAHHCGQKPTVQEWFTRTWLSKVKTEYLLDAI